MKLPTQAGGGNRSYHKFEAVQPRRSTPTQQATVKNRKNIRRFSVAGRYQISDPDNPLRINAGEPIGEGGVLRSTCHLIHDSSSSTQKHLDAKLGSQREGRVGHDRMINYEVHLVPLDNGRQDQSGFDHGELGADADPRSTLA